MSEARLRRCGLLGAVVLALAVPVAITFWLKDLSHGIRPVREQHSTYIGALSASDADHYRAFATRRQASILVLSYHDVRPADEVSTRADRDVDIYTITPEEFATQLRMLREAGFESISTETLVRSRQYPAVLPARPLMITFDDGTSGLWRYADPLFEQYGFRGVAFTITGRVDTRYPYYLTWDELTALQETGRWDIESHTHQGHDRIPSGNGRQTPFLINLIQRPDGSLETQQEARVRVAADADQAINQLTSHGLPRPRLFAYPFSAESNPTNNPEFAVASREILAQRYPLLMINLDTPRWASPDDLAAGLIPRIEVTKQTTARELFDRIVAALPAPQMGDPFGQPMNMAPGNGQPPR
ncbi:MAG: polysaccharide deacetylase family protein [Pseudonocardiaceae bacterium]